VGSVYITGKRSYQARDGLSILQENGRIAIKLIEQELSRAGYPTFEEIEPIIHDADQLDRLIAANGGVAKSVGIHVSADGTESDTVTITYDPVKGGGYDHHFKCNEINGIAIQRTVSSYTVKKGKLILSRYYVENGPPVCHSKDKPVSEPLAENLHAMQVEYGVDTSGDGYADRYFSASDVPDWEAVRSIRIALLVSSSEAVLDKKADQVRVYLLGGNRIEVDPDKKIYRVFSTTIPLRNKMPIL
jgi:type IV pilus assembly protein PilW